jgi:outer membrane immunogenic protein
MKKFLLAGAALAALAAPATAADMAARAPIYTKAPPMAAVYNWTGCYLGGEGGGAWGRSRDYGAVSGNAFTNSFNLSGAIAGGTLGCNYQVSSVVLGVEGDISWTNKSGSGTDILVPTTTNTTSEKWLDTVRGRVGFAWDRVLLFATGGGAFSNVSFSACNSVTGLCDSGSQNRSGWTVGGGLEWAFADNWSAKFEYLHVDLGTGNLGAAPTFAARNIPVTDDLVRVGVNYRINWGGPVVARY